MENSPKTSTGDEGIEAVGPTCCVKGAMSMGVRAELQDVEELEVVGRGRALTGEAEVWTEGEGEGVGVGSGLGVGSGVGVGDKHGGDCGACDCCV